MFREYYCPTTFLVIYLYILIYLILPKHRNVLIFTSKKKKVIAEKIWINQTENQDSIDYSKLFWKVAVLEI